MMSEEDLDLGYTAEFGDKGVIFKIDGSSYDEYCDICNVIIQVGEDFVLAADKAEDSSSEGMCICEFCARAIARIVKEFEHES